MEIKPLAAPPRSFPVSVAKARWEVRGRAPRPICGMRSLWQGETGRTHGVDGRRQFYSAFRVCATGVHHSSLLTTHIYQVLLTLHY